MALDLPGDRFRLKSLSSQDMLKALKRDARAGLLHAPRSLPPKYFYDEAGSRLFDEICQTPDYYLTRTELALLQRHADAIIKVSRPNTCVELGAGASVKTEVLLSRLSVHSDAARYVTIDVCEAVLVEAAGRLLQAFPRLKIESLAGEYHDGIEALSRLERPVLYVFLGSSIGNFTEAEAVELLSRLAGKMASGDHLLLGLDRVKDRGVLERAYDDAQGVTARFNLNVLEVLNARLGADFRPDGFSHLAVYDDAEAQIEMYLVAGRDQEVALPAIGASIQLHEGERILTEISRKYTRSSIRRLLSKSGLCEQAHFVPDSENFSLVLAKPAG